MKSNYVQRQDARVPIEAEWTFEFGPPLFIKNEEPSAPSAARFRYLALGAEGIKLADSLDGFCSVHAWQTHNAFVIQSVPECIDRIDAAIFDGVAKDYPY